MSWGLSLLVAILGAAIGCVLAGAIALFAVDWYRISSFEGKSGYFVIAIGLVGFVAGLVIALVASRIVAAGAHPGFLRALGVSQLVLIVIAALIGGGVRLAADVPPKIGGEALLLVVELRWPASQTTSPATDTTPRRLRLHAVSNRVARLSKDGPLWMEDAHLVDGQWVVPGAVEVFTSRGERMLEIEPAPRGATAFIVPLPAYPRASQLAWSEWMPRTRAGSPASSDGFTIRFKVLPRNQPVRTQTFGAFQVSSLIGAFQPEYPRTLTGEMAASATFLVQHRGVPVTIDGKRENGATMRFDRARSVAVLPGAKGLLVRAANTADDGPIYLLVPSGDSVHAEHVSEQSQLDAPMVTNDLARFTHARAGKPLPGTVDRTTYAEPGVYLFDGALLSTQPPEVRRFSATGDLRLDPNVRPLGISPDGHRVVRLGWSADYKGRALVVTDAESGESHFVPVDAARTRLGAVRDLDPEWLQHYFAWVPGDGGKQQLEARSDVVPMPHRGVYSIDDEGYREYQVEPAGQAMFDAFTTWLVSEMKATRTPEDLAAYGYNAHVEGRLVHVINHESEHHVGLFMDRGTDTQLVETIGRRFDVALKTGRFDSLFTY